MPKDAQPPEGYPHRIFVQTYRGGVKHNLLTFYFDCIAPITGDGVYRHEEQSGGVRHALLINRNAHAHQLHALRTR